MKRIDKIIFGSFAFVGLFMASWGLCVLLFVIPQDFVKMPQVGQTWVYYDTINPFDHRIDTIEILEIKRNWARVRHGGVTENSLHFERIVNRYKLINN